jgi:F0F1-type ATP synthase membrane subunit c/vacuolar-type H+-ATPase subunit K
MTPEGHTNLENQHRTLLIIWAFLFMSVAGLFLMTVFIPSKAEGDNMIMVVVAIAVGLSNVILSFVIKQSFLAKSVAKQDVKLVVQAYIVALALCESAALFGMFVHFAAGSIYYYVPFAIGAMGMLLHFPKKQHLLDATPFKKL